MSNQRSSVAYSLNAKLSFKLIVVGDSAVGKTSLIVKYVKNTFSKNHSVSLGVQFYSKIVEVQKQEVAMQIWDTAGQQNYKSIVKSFYNQACCVIVVYCDPQLASKSIQEYLFDINEHAAEGVRVVIARTKADENPITQEERGVLDECVARVENIDFWMEVSAKEGRNIGTFFSTVAKNLLARYISDRDFKELVDPKQGSFLIKRENVPEHTNNKGGCCQ